jgi:glutamate--cysteine ligase
MTNVHDLTSVLESKRKEITAWMATKREEISIPIYGSVDIRDAGWKVGVVDANHFPAGFNNIAEDDFPHLSELFKAHILRTKPECKSVHIYPESHTRNLGYIENIATIQRLIKGAGFVCTVGSPELSELGFLKGISGPLKLEPVDVDSEGELIVGGVKPDLILLNNDLTNGKLPGLTSPSVTPPTEMGWHQRKKSEHYRCLQGYVDEISEMIGIDPWHLMPEWFVSKDKCLTEEACKTKLASEINEFIAKIQARYDAYGIDRTPAVVMKNDRGTYGLGIMILTSGDQILNLSNRKINKLRYAKGGADVESYLIQEGIPTSMLTDDGEPVEPVVYLVDGEAAAWFYRINPKKSDMDNLNSPSARFENYTRSGDKYGTHAHGWHALLAELSMLAMGAELNIKR